MDETVEVEIGYIKNIVFKLKLYGKLYGKANSFIYYKIKVRSWNFQLPSFSAISADIFLM